MLDAEFDAAIRAANERDAASMRPLNLEEAALLRRVLRDQAARDEQAIARGD